MGWNHLPSRASKHGVGGKSLKRHSSVSAGVGVSARFQICVR